MKKFISHSGIAVILSLLLSSCFNNSSLTVEKRHYRKGYYISFEKDKAKENLSINCQNNVFSQDEVEQPHPADIQIANINIEKTNADDDKLRLSEEEKKAEDRSQAKRKNPFAAKALKQAIPSEEIFETKGLIQKCPQPQDRSLIWIIVVILLILWLIGFISGGWGLGGILHLLLIVALVLFILWLLGII